MNQEDGQAPRAMVFAPSPLLTVTIETRSDGADDIHLHAGGQGVWIARMLAELDLDVRLCGPFGDESGTVLTTLVERDGIGVRAFESAAGNGGYVHDRREGAREAVATTPPPPLPRHELDGLYNLALVEGLESAVAVLGGPDGDGVLSPDTYRRLASDLTAGGVPVVADLSGDYLKAVLAGGVAVLKTSHEDLVRDGHASSEDPDELLATIEKLAGAATVIVSRADQPTFARIDGRLVEVHLPRFDPLDHRGAGDSMTAGVTAALARGADLEDALRLGAAAGALNATRHGLATGERELIERLAARVEVRPIGAGAAR